MPKQQENKKTGWGVPETLNRRKAGVRKGSCPKPIAAITTDGRVVPPSAYRADLQDVLLEA